MKRIRFTEEQIVAVLCEHEAGADLTVFFGIKEDRYAEEEAQAICIGGLRAGIICMAATLRRPAPPATQVLLPGLN